jgi:hypothetical protein
MQVCDPRGTIGQPSCASSQHQSTKSPEADPFSRRIGKTTTAKKEIVGECPTKVVDDSGSAAKAVNVKDLGSIIHHAVPHCYDS